MFWLGGTYSCAAPAVGCAVRAVGCAVPVRCALWAVACAPPAVGRRSGLDVTALAWLSRPTRDPPTAAVAPAQSSTHRPLAVRRTLCPERLLTSRRVSFASRRDTTPPRKNEPTFRRLAVN